MSFLLFSPKSVLKAREIRTDVLEPFTMKINYQNVALNAFWKREDRADEGSWRKKLRSILKMCGKECGKLLCTALTDAQMIC